MACGPRRLLARRDDGAVAVEFALVAPLLMMIFFGVITFALTYNDHLSINNAGREGARYGAALDYTTDPSAWGTSIRDRIKQTYFNSFSTLDDQNICVDLVNPAGTVVTNAASVQAKWLGTGCVATTPPTVPTSMTTGSCAVRIWVVKSARLSWLLVPDKTFDIEADSVAYYGLKAGTCTAP